VTIVESECSNGRYRGIYLRANDAPDRAPLMSGNCGQLGGARSQLIGNGWIVLFTSSRNGPNGR
jgi:hypothetical protein